MIEERLQSSTSHPFQFFLVLSTDHLTGATGKSPSITLSKDGGTLNVSASGAVTELASGWYSWAGNATDRGTVGELVAHITATGCDPLDERFCIVGWDPFDAVRMGLTALPNANAEASGGLYTRGNGAGQINQPSSGLIDVNAKQLLGTAFATPATAGVIDVNVKNMNNVAATSITTINANQGTTQPENFTGTGATALVKSDVTDIAGAAVSTSTAQLGVNAVNWANGAIPSPNVTGVPLIDIKYLLGTIFTEGATGRLVAGIKQFFNVASPTSTMNEVTLVDTTTVATTVTNLTNAPTNGDFTTTMKTSLNAATPASVTGAVGSVTGNVGGNVVGSVGSVVATVAANLTQILGTALTETAGLLAGGFKKLFNVATPTGTLNSLPSAIPGASGGLFIAGTNAAATGVSADVQTGLTAQGYTTVRAAFIDENISAVPGDVWDVGQGSFVTGSYGELITESLDATISSRLSTADLVSDSGTAQSGSVTTIKLRAGAPSNTLVGQTVFIIGGTGIYQSAPITAYNTTTKIATTAWGTAPDVTSQYVVLSLQGGSSGGSGLTAAQVWAYIGSTGLSEDTTLAAIYQKTLASPIQFINPFIVVNKTLGPIVAGDAYTTANSRQIDMPVPGNVPINSTASTPSLKLPNEDGTEQTIIGVGVQISSQWYARFQLTSVETAALAISSAGQNITYAAKAIATADSTVLTVQQGPLIVSASL